MINVEVLDKNEIHPAVTIPTGAMPDIVNPVPTVKPSTPNKFSETIVKIFFLFSDLCFFL